MDVTPRARSTTEEGSGAPPMVGARKRTVLCVANKRLPRGDYRLTHPQLSSHFRVRYALPDPPQGVAESDFARFAFGEGFKLRYLLEFWKLYRYLAAHRAEIDLVHFYSTNLVLLGPMIASLARVPAVSTLTGFGRLFASDSPYPRVLRGVYWMLLGLSLRCCRKLLLQNHSDLELLARRFPDLASRIRYVGSTVSIQRVDSKDFTSVPLVVIHVARLMSSKGIDEYLSVARRLAGPSFRFRLIGPASVGSDELFGRVRVAHAEGVIEYLGELDSDAMIAQLGQAHILFFPSRGEGLSRAVLEAGFTRVFPIVYDIPSNRDLVRAGGGILLAEGDIDGAIAALRELDVDRQRLRAETERFQDWILEQYDSVRFAARLDAIYAEALGA